MNSAEEKYRALEERYKTLFEKSADAFLIIVNDKFVDCNMATVEMLDYRNKQELLNTHPSVLSPPTQPDGRDSFEKANEMMAIALDKGSHRFEWEYKRYNGEVFPVEVLLTAIPSDAGTMIHVVWRDITDRKDAEKRLEASEKRYKTLFDKSADAMLIIVNDKFVDCNMATVEMLDYRNKQELLNTHPSVLSPPTQPDGRDSFEKANEMMAIALDKGSHRFEWEYKRYNGEVFPVEVLLTAIPSDAGTMIHVVWRDITDRKKAHELITYQAKHDLLTGLNNRYEFERSARELLSDSKNKDTEHALCYLDLDQFKVVNDTCGHLAGDELLRQIGKILNNTISARDTLARLGGDEFGVLLQYCSIRDAQRVTSSILDAIQDYRFTWEGRTFRVGVSIGLVPITSFTRNLTDLMKDADAACYTAKDKGRNCIHVSTLDDSDVAHHHGQLQWVNRINDALNSDSYELFGQDISSLNGSDEKYCEILLRMKDADGNMISPGDFLPAAERYNLTTQIDFWVIRNAFRLLKEFPSIFQVYTSFSINLSGACITKPETFEYIKENLKESGIKGENICFEITETAAISNLVYANELISYVKKLGCKFSLDDFGSGLSSFAYLKNLPVDYLKIDGLFVKNIVEDKIDFSMVKAINEVGHLMGMQTIAEYVENGSIYDRLCEIGVDFAQGFFISKPEALTGILQASTDSIRINRL